MPTFKLEADTWKQRSPLSKALFAGTLKNYRILAGSHNSADEIADYDTYAARNANVNIYLVPRVVAASAAPTGTPVPVRVAVWAPQVDALQQSHESRLLLLEDALFKSRSGGTKAIMVPEKSVQGIWGETVTLPAGPVLDLASSGQSTGVDVFLAPEYVFNLFPQKAAHKNVQPCTVAERDLLVQRLLHLSVRFPATVIIPGTIVWYDNIKQVHYNSTYVIHAGDLVQSTAGHTRYDKCLVDDYEKRFIEHLAWGAGPTPYFAFVHPILKLDCLLQICADHGVTLQGPAPDLQLVTATGLAASSSADTHPGGFCVHVDGVGMWRCIPKANKGAAVMKQNPFEMLQLTVLKP